LKKATDDIANLQKILSEKESEIAFLQSEDSEQGGDSRVESKVRELELGSERNEREINRL